VINHRGICAYPLSMRAIALLLLAVHALALEVKPPDPTCAVGDLLTWEIRGAPAAWTASDVSVGPCLVIEGPDHTRWRRPVFAYRAYRPHPVEPDPAAPELDPAGDPLLQARHTPRVAGVHRWTLVAPDGAISAQGEITASTSDRPVGPLRVAPYNQRLLAFADGRPFIPIGPNIAWANGPDRLANFERYFAALAENGGTHCRVWMSSWCGQIEGDQPDAWRLDHAWLIDEVLRRARAHGLRVTLVLDDYWDLVTGKCVPYGATTVERQKNFIAADLPLSYVRRLRYVLARWGADDTILAWELYNELDMAQPVREKCVPWVRSAAAMLRRLDQDHRLRTVSWCGDDFEKVMGIDGIDLAQVHGYVLEWADPGGTKKPKTRDGVRMLLEPMGVAAQLGKPYCFSELGYQGDKDSNQGNELDDEGLLLRQQAWAGLMLGGYGSGMNWWWDTYIDRQHLWSQYRGLARAVARIDWHDAELAPLSPNAFGDKVMVMGWLSSRQGLVWPQPRADTWYARFIERKERIGLGVPLQLGLPGLAPDQAFTIHWLDMVSGDERQALEARSAADGTLTVFVRPPALDAVIWIEAHAEPRK
jgi:hypothetical protein